MAPSELSEVFREGKEYNRSVRLNFDRGDRMTIGRKEMKTLPSLFPFDLQKHPEAQISMAGNFYSTYFCIVCLSPLFFLSSGIPPFLVLLFLSSFCSGV